MTNTFWTIDEPIMATASPVYLDCNATTPIEPAVLEIMNHYFREEYGNAGSRTHAFGAAAAQAVRRAREQVAKVVATSWENVFFTSGATEADNLAILGSAIQAEKLGKRHIISTQIEHKAVLEPLAALENRGFEVTLLPPCPGGYVEPELVRRALRPDTFLVSVMHANNETGVIQPLTEIAEVLADHEAALHTDAAQGFGKELGSLKNPRFNLVSVSAHKVFGPKGVGALIVRQNDRSSQLSPIMFGGGQEHGLRPGTLPVPLIAGFGLAAEIALQDHLERYERCLAFRRDLISALAPLNPQFHGDQDCVLSHVINLRFDTIDSEAVMIALRDLVAISNGSACTSSTIEPSHVLISMAQSQADAAAATRWSWCHLTPQPDWLAIRKKIELLY
jgi:cysteine desulfurase